MTSPSKTIKFNFSALSAVKYLQFIRENPRKSVVKTPIQQRNLRNQRLIKSVIICLPQHVVSWGEICGHLYAKHPSNREICEICGPFYAKQTQFARQPNACIPFDDKVLSGNYNFVETQKQTQFWVWSVN